MQANGLTPSWRFAAGSMAGTIMAGQEHGIEITRGADGGPVTRPMCMNLEHYYSTSVPNGFFIPRNKAPLTARQTADNAVRIEIEPLAPYAVQSVIDFRLREDAVFEVTYTFAFSASYRRFEVLISNYFHENTPPFIRVGGTWVQPALPGIEHRYYCRSAADAASLAKALVGQTAELKAQLPHFDFDNPIDPLRYDRAVMVSPIRDTGWSVIHWVDEAWCTSLSANRRWNAHDFSLVGRDVDAGERIACRAWMAYRKLASLDEALDLARTR